MPLFATMDAEAETVRLRQMIEGIEEKLANRECSLFILMQASVMLGRTQELIRVLKNQDAVDRSFEIKTSLRLKELEEMIQCIVKAAHVLEWEKS